jgi:hypothetical protein
MNKEREQTTSSSGLPPSDDAITAHKGVLQRLIDKFRGPQFALGYPPPDWLFLKEDEILRPAQKSLEELRIVVPPNISPERLVIEGCWGDGFPEVKLMRADAPNNDGVIMIFLTRRSVFTKGTEPLQTEVNE